MSLFSYLIVTDNYLINALPTLACTFKIGIMNITFGVYKSRINLNYFWLKCEKTKKVCFCKNTKIIKKLVVEKKKTVKNKNLIEETFWERHRRESDR